MLLRSAFYYMLWSKRIYATIRSIDENVKCKYQNAK